MPVCDSLLMPLHLPITRRSMIGGLVAAPLAPGSPPPRRKPNFLFILADDHAPYVMGCDGNSKARTPNIDRFAGQGVRFSSHYCNSPVCTPSRQSFLTGQLPHSAGVTVLTTPLALDKPTLARQFRKAGYRTAVFGKMHFNRLGRPGLHGFDVAHTEDRILREWQSAVIPHAIPSGIRTKPPWRPFKDPARIWLNSEKLSYPRLDAGMRGTYIADRAIESGAKQSPSLRSLDQLS